MKSCLLFAVALTLFSAPVRSATPAPSFFAAKPANCAKASSTLNVAAAAQAPRPSFFREGSGAAGIPQPVFDTGCTAEVECPGAFGSHTPLSCTGVSSCSVGEYWVTCDGTTHYCGCVGCDLCHCDCFEGGGSPSECLQECKFDC